MDMLIRKVKMIRTVMDGKQTEFIIMKEEDGITKIVNLLDGKITLISSENEEVIEKVLIEQKIAKNEEEAEDLTSFILTVNDEDNDEADYTLDSFNENVKEYSENNKEKLTDKVYQFLSKSEVTWINQSTAFRGPDSPKDYFIGAEMDEEPIEFYFPYQMDAEYESENLEFDEKEIDQIFDAYHECSYYYVESE